MFTSYVLSLPSDSRDWVGADGWAGFSRRNIFDHAPALFTTKNVDRGNTCLMFENNNSFCYRGRRY